MLLSRHRIIFQIIFLSRGANCSFDSRSHYVSVSLSHCSSCQFNMAGKILATVFRARFSPIVNKTHASVGSVGSVGMSTRVTTDRDDVINDSINVSRREYHVPRYS